MAKHNRFFYGMIVNWIKKPAHLKKRDNTQNKYSVSQQQVNQIGLRLQRGDSNLSYFVAHSILVVLHMMYGWVYNKKQTKTKATSAFKPQTIFNLTKRDLYVLERRKRIGIKEESEHQRRHRFNIQKGWSTLLCLSNKPNFPLNRVILVQHSWCFFLSYTEVGIGCRTVLVFWRRRR